MAIVEPAVWSATEARTVGLRRSYNGVGYEANTAGVASATIPPGNPDWVVFAIFRITDHYSLQEAVEFELNSNNKIINASIPLYIQNTEQKLEKIFRSPGQRVVRNFPMIDSSFALPSDLIEITHVRWNSDSAGSATLLERGALSIQRADRTTFETIRQSYQQYGYFPDFQGIDYPVYWMDDSSMYVAPGYDDGEEIEMTYWQRVPTLGEIAGLLDNDFFPINAADQTLVEWVAEGNLAADFIQDEVVTLRNLWTATVPHVLKAGAMAEAKLAENDRDGAAIWKTEFQELVQFTVEEFKKFDTAGSISIQQMSQYDSF